MEHSKKIPLTKKLNIEHKFDPKTGMHSFIMRHQSLYYQQVLSAESFVSMTPDLIANYFYTMKKHFDIFVDEQMQTPLYGGNKPSWMGATHNHYIEDEAYTPEWKSYVKKAKSKKDDIAVLARELPGMGERVLCPDKNCDNPDHKMTLYYMIQHVNDEHRWKREDIADWLETLDIDLSFKTPTEKKVEIL